MHLRLLVFILLVGYSGSPIWATESKKCSNLLLVPELTNPYLPILRNRTYDIDRLNRYSNDTWTYRERNTITRGYILYQGKHGTEVRTDLTTHEYLGTGVGFHTGFFLIARDPVNGLLYRAKQGSDGQYGQWQQEGAPRHHLPPEGSQVQWLHEKNYQVPPNILRPDSVQRRFRDVMVSTIKYLDGTKVVSVYARDIGIVYSEESSYEFGTIYEQSWYEYDWNEYEPIDYRLVER